jgi:hypothetical protein
MEVMYRVMQESQTSIGTVVGDDGGTVRVQIDEEAGPREVGFPRMRGQRFTKGQRVPIHRAKGGNEFLGGSLSTVAGRDPVVDKADMVDESVDNDVLHQTVKNNITDAQQKGQQGINDAKRADDEAKEARRRADNAQSDANKGINDAQNAKNDAQDAKQDASAAQNDANDAKSIAQDALQKANNIEPGLAKNEVQKMIDDAMTKHEKGHP